MPTIESIQITNFKSLRSLSFEPQALSVFVGPNSAGKSNLLDAFMFLRDLVRNGQSAVSLRGGYSSIVWGGRDDEKITFVVQGKLRTQIEDYEYRYFLELSAKSYESFSVSKEFFEVLEGSDRSYRLLDFPDKGGMAALYSIEGTHIGNISNPVMGSNLHGISPRQDPRSPLAAFSDYVQNWEVYDLIPSMMRGAVPIRRELKLLPRGENLAGVLHTLHSEYVDIFGTIEDHLHQLIPEKKQLLSLLTPEGMTSPGLEETGHPTKIPALAFSSGTLRFLAFLVALYSPGAAPLVCLEEPENYIHPHGLQLLVEILISASLRRQIFVSTHSPYLLNSLDPESVYVVEKIMSETRVTHPSTRKNLKSLLRKIGLGEAWYAGSIGGVPKRTE